MPQVSRTWLINGLVRPLSPDSLIETCEEEGLPTDWHGLVNGVAIPRGRRAGEAHFLVLASDLDSLQSGQFSIKCVHEDGETIWPGWYLEIATAVTKQSNPAYWVVLRDVRWLLEKSAVAGDDYNLLKSSGTYVAATTNSGTPWTWQQVLTQLWAKLPGAIAGTCPTLPYTPGSTPENLSFDDVGAWRAINQVLTAVGCVLVRNPFSGAFTFERLSVSQNLTALDGYSLLWNDRATATNYAIPNEAVVLFPYGPTGSTTYTPFRQKWAEVASIGGTQGQYEITDPMFYFSGREADIIVRAAEVADALAGLLDPKANPFAATYAGAKSVSPGTRLSSVRWVSDGTRGFETQVFYEPEDIDWPVCPPIDEIGSGSSSVPRVVRFTLNADISYVAGANVAATVTATNDGSATGGTITVNASWPIRAKSGAIGTAFRTEGGIYWIIDIQLPDTITGTLDADPESAHESSVEITVDNEWHDVFSSSPLTVYNPDGILYGAWAGSHCTAKYNPVAARYELVAVQKYATRLIGLVQSGNTTFSVNAGIDGPLPPSIAVDDVLNISNSLDMFVCSGMLIKVELYETTVAMAPVRVWDVYAHTKLRIVQDVAATTTAITKTVASGFSDCNATTNVVDLGPCPTPPGP